MYITKKHLPRRTLLRGLGAAIALPLLDAMIPAGTALAQTAAAPSPKLGFIYFPHGAVMGRWTPEATGADFLLPQILQPLEAFRNNMTIVSGLRNKPSEGAAVHSITPGTWLSCVSPGSSERKSGAKGVTADQIAAQYLGQDTPFPSLELSVEVKASSGGNCDPDYGCGLGSTVAFRTPSQPLPMEHNPRKLFYRLFGQGDTLEERQAIISQTGSLLDLVSENASSLRRDLSTADQVLMNDYLDSVREIERQVQKASSQDLSSIVLPETPAGVPASFEEHIGMMFDLMALSFQANLTRVASMMMAAETSSLTYNQIGISDAFHPLSHHQNNVDKLERLAKVQTYHSTLFARFLERLANTPDGDGSLLEHSILLYGSNMSNSNVHDASPLPSVVFGRGHGRIKGGQHLSLPADTPLANLLLTMLERGGVPVESHGDSTGLVVDV